MASKESNMTQRAVRSRGSEKWAYEFRAAEGSRISDTDAKRVGPELVRINERYGDIKPSVVVDEARNPRSKLHRYFEWDIHKAAQKHWLEQARHLIRSVKILVKTSAYEQPTEVRAFVKHIAIADGYKPIVEVFTREDHRKLIIGKALEELEVWKQRYQEMIEFAGLFEMIAQVSRKMRKVA